ncbi:MAG: ATP-binding protein [Deltaproteobacteria bacterium]|nr:ATP-binding protein [Deltaproteobacteria bacterium]
MARQQFWERFNFDPRTVHLERLRRLTTTTSLNDIVDIEINDYIADQVAEKLVQVLTDCNCQLPAGKVALIVSELVDNFAQHSGQILAALTLQFYPTPRNLLIAIADCGIGIKESLASNPRYSWLAEQPHHVAVLEAFKPTVSRKPEGGTGFTDVLEGVTELGGQLRLATGNEYIIVKKGKAVAGQLSFDLPGVQIELSLPERK